MEVSMTTNAQRNANAHNALLSTGPRSEEGLAKSSQSALTHGLYATQVSPIVKGNLAEDPEAIEAFVASVVTSLRPETVPERERAMRIAMLYLRIRRISRVEVFGLGESDDPDILLKLEDLVSRVDARTARELESALSAYRDTQDRREQLLKDRLERFLFEASWTDPYATAATASHQALTHNADSPPTKKPAGQCLSEFLESVATASAPARLRATSRRLHSGQIDQMGPSAKRTQFSRSVASCPGPNQRSHPQIARSCSDKRARRA
jgi:hypothetical protein